MSESETAALLRQSPVGRLGLVLPDGRPYVVPVNFVYRQGAIYIHSSAEGLKAQAASNNPRACFEVDEPGAVLPADSACEVSFTYRSAIAFGTIQTVDDPAEKVAALEAFASKYAPALSGTVAPSAAAGTAVLKLVVERVTGKKNSAERGR
jgi:nitroimidazol reductase NimA-like FMN-containing flavoprotein (pyridoxamine 5'-phosphate oxidase superfamily)